MEWGIGAVLGARLISILLWCNVTLGVVTCGAEAWYALARGIMVTGVGIRAVLTRRAGVQISLKFSTC